MPARSNSASSVSSGASRMLPSMPPRTSSISSSPLMPAVQRTRETSGTRWGEATRASLISSRVIPADRSAALSAVDRSRVCSAMTTSIASVASSWTIGPTIGSPLTVAPAYLAMRWRFFSSLTHLLSRITANDLGETAPPLAHFLWASLVARPSAAIDAVARAVPHGDPPSGGLLWQVRQTLITALDFWNSHVGHGIVDGADRHRRTHLDGDYPWGSAPHSGLTARTR